MLRKPFKNFFGKSSDLWGFSWNTCGWSFKNYFGFIWIFFRNFVKSHTLNENPQEIARSIYVKNPVGFLRRHLEEFRKKNPSGIPERIRKELLGTKSDAISISIADKFSKEIPGRFSEEIVEEFLKFFWNPWRFSTDGSRTNYKGMP